MSCLYHAWNISTKSKIETKVGTNKLGCPMQYKKIKKQHNRQVVCLRKWKCKWVSKKDREDGSMSP